MTAYYNEIDTFAADWLENLIAAGYIAPGVVDRRSIEDIHPNDIKDFTQCHFFAGIGVWSYALRGAGWDDSRRVWTGSCPCQPFSEAGKGNGFDDERHLWPAFFHLIQQCKPSIVFGEQVASKAVDAWIDLVQDDMEALGYSVGAVAFPAASVGAPHIRDRTYWVADSEHNGHREPNGLTAQSSSYGEKIGLFDRNGSPSEANGYWRNGYWYEGNDGNQRIVKPGIVPLVDGATSRVGRLRAYGNAIVAPQAEEFVRAYLTR